MSSAFTLRIHTTDSEAAREKFGRSPSIQQFHYYIPPPIPTRSKSTQNLGSKKTPRHNCHKTTLVSHQDECPIITFEQSPSPPTNPTPNTPRS
jgi:hypothetical protein